MKPVLTRKMNYFYFRVYSTDRNIHILSFFFEFWSETELEKTNYISRLLMYNSGMMNDLDEDLEVLDRSERPLPPNLGLAEGVVDGRLRVINLPRPIAVHLSVFF